MLNDFLTLIFPKVCYACGKSLYKQEDCICIYCQYHLPKTNFHLYADNPVMKIFDGRVNIHSASSLYLFNRGSQVQHLIHQLKYRGKQEIGVSLGRHYGRELKIASLFASATMIIPVPLHKKKLRKRGYNQSEAFAAGLSEALNVTNCSNALIRTHASQSQTNKSRYQRWKNVENIFTVNAPEKLQGKHILLADDVVTTGSTLEACANRILAIPGTRVSVVAIASTLY